MSRFQFVSALLLVTTLGACNGPPPPTGPNAPYVIGPVGEADNGAYTLPDNDTAADESGNGFSDFLSIASGLGVGAIAAKTGNDALFGAAGSVIGSSIANSSERNTQTYDGTYSSGSYQDSSMIRTSSGNDCWTRAQDRILAELKPRISATPSICPSAQLNYELFRQLRPAAQRCNVPPETIAEIDRMLSESQDVIDASCI